MLSGELSIRLTALRNGDGHCVVGPSEVAAQPYARTAWAMALWP